MPRDPRIDAYIAARADFARPILDQLREWVHAACPSVEESIKWGMPFYSYGGRPLANMAAFKAHASFGVWHRHELATGHEGEAMGQYGRIESLADLPPPSVIDDQLHAAMALIDGGAVRQRAAKPPKPEAAVPAALAEALARDDAAAATFDGFPPGCRREYCEWIAEAKRPETRDRRVADAIGWLREGKKRNWKYETC